MERSNLRRINLIYARCGTSNIRVAGRCATGTVVLILRLNTVIPYPTTDSIHGEKDCHLPCAFATLRLEQMPDIILFRDCILHSFSYCLIVILDRTVPDSILPHCDAEHRIAVSPEDVQPGTVVRILRLSTVIPCPAGNSIHGDKDCHLSCACATLRLEQMPDIILFRDCTLLSFLFLPFSCFPDYHYDAVQ